MENNYRGIYNGLKVLVTGHTGFKGAWLTVWLKELGASVIGYSLDSPTTPNLFSSCLLQKEIHHVYGDVRDFEHLAKTIQQEKPTLIFHLAAQSLVLDSYKNPLTTFQTNTQGTVNILEAALKCSSVKAMVMVTTDKVYENIEQLWGYREIDRLGGDDPYSASKAMAEIAIESYRKSFVNPTRKLGIASARAGNVIGGGDFSENRMIPDAMRALMSNEPILVRNPKSIRPWMHVLEPLSGYLLLGYHLLNHPEKFSQAWNFAPQENRGISCRELIEKTIEFWGGGDWISEPNLNSPHEMKLLRLNGEKAANLLEWTPCYNWEKALEMTVNWYKQFYENRDMYKVCVNQIHSYSNMNRNQVLEVVST